MEQQKPKDRMIWLLLIAAFACLLGTALLLVLKNSRGAPIFAEFSENDVLDGSRDCCLNALTVLDRYAEKEENGAKSQLMLVYYPDKDDRPVVLSLLTEEGDGLYEPLSPYYTEEETDSLLTVSGYFFTGMLAREGAGVERMFREDANAFAEWYAEPVVQREIVLTYAGETEEAYIEAVKAKSAWMQIAAIALASLGVMCALFIPIRITVNKRRQNG